MNDLVKTDKLKENIVAGLLIGLNPDTLSEKLKCDISEVLKVLESSDFLEMTKEYLEKDIQISGLAAFQNIKKIAKDDKISAATQLKANQWIAEKALEVNKLGNTDDTPATMSQDQLARRLKELQSEAIKRAKPIDTGVIEHSPSDKLSDMME